MNQANWLQIEMALRIFPAKVIETTPVLFLTSLWVDVYAGRILQMFDAVSEIPFDEGSLTEEQTAEFVTLRSYYVYNILHDFEECISQTSYALDHLPPDAGLQRGYAYVFYCGALQALGRFDQAEVAAHKRLHESDMPVEKGYLLLVLCYLHFLENNPGEITSIAQQLINLGEQADYPEMLANGYHFAALAAYTRGDMKAAIHFAQKAHELRHFTIGVIHLMNAICYAYSLSFSGKSNKGAEVLDSIRDYVLQTQNGIYAAFLAAAESFLAYGTTSHKADLTWTLNLADLPRVSLTNFINLPITAIQLLLHEQQPDTLNRAGALINEYQKHASDANNGRIILELKLLEALHEFCAGRHENGLALFEDCTTQMIDCGVVSPIREMSPIVDRILKQHSESITNSGYLANIITKQSGDLHLLTPRERQILNFIRQGLTNKEIGQELYISEKTVKRHANGLYKKLGVSGRKELATLDLEA
jgi:ATP/maltotriose-dependent transcriptional regulator MalT